MQYPISEEQGLADWFTENVPADFEKVGDYEAELRIDYAIIHA